MNLRHTSYYIFVDRIPVKMGITPENWKRVTSLNLETLLFERASQYKIDEIHLGRNAEMDEITEEENKQIEERMKKLGYSW